MNKVLEINIDSPDGVVDCQVERIDDSTSYSVILLYPHLVNGKFGSRVYFITMHFNEAQKRYFFDTGEDIHPAVKALEEKISRSILADSK
ncbi:MAG: hypothetical protein JSS96_00795 [Bacteroidetes bacterium]|nr:hypothetical protein [Bacteroidota bacterium]